jgi:hypothetical protein
MQNHTNVPFTTIDIVNDEHLKIGWVARQIAERLKFAFKSFKAETRQTNREIADITGLTETQLKSYLYYSPPMNLKTKVFERLARYAGADPIDILEIPPEPTYADPEPEEDQVLVSAVTPEMNDLHLQRLQYDKARQDRIRYQVQLLVDAEIALTGITAETISIECGWHESALMLYLNGDWPFTYEVVFTLSKWFNIKAHQIDPELRTHTVLEEDLDEMSPSFRDQKIVDIVFEFAPRMSAVALKSIMNECMAIGWGLESTTNTDHTLLPTPENDDYF